MPGFGAGDRSTALIRTFLGSLGYGTHPWKLGTNLGPAMPDLAARLITRLEQIFEANGNQKISLVGWRLGGVCTAISAPAPRQGSPGNHPGQPFRRQSSPN